MEQDIKKLSSPIAEESQKKSITKTIRQQVDR